jgi:hypothetical protein
MGSSHIRASALQAAAAPLQALERDAPPAGPIAPARADEHQKAPEQAIVCATCGHAITCERERIQILDAHEHRFMNPAGRLFHIGCFARAHGCVPIGAPSGDYPWFPGFDWRIALCGGCADHLGWVFQSPDRAFFGLRLDHLRAGGAT